MPNDMVKNFLLILLSAACGAETISRDVETIAFPRFIVGDEGKSRFCRLSLEGLEQGVVVTSIDIADGLGPETAIMAVSASDDLEIDLFTRKDACASISTSLDPRISSTIYEIGAPSYVMTKSSERLQLDLVRRSVESPEGIRTYTVAHGSSAPDNTLPKIGCVYNELERARIEYGAPITALYFVRDRLSFKNLDEKSLYLAEEFLNYSSKKCETTYNNAIAGPEDLAGVQSVLRSFAQQL